MSNSDKFSVMVRARLLFQRTIQKDLSLGYNNFDERYLERLVFLRNKMEQEQFKYLRHFIYALLVLLFLRQGGDLTIPWGEIRLAAIPAIKEILIIFACLNLVMYAVYFVNTQAYVGLIDSFLYFRTGGGQVDIEVIRASYVSEFFFLKIFRPNFDFYNDDVIEMGLAAKAISWFTSWGLMVLVQSALIVSVSFLLFVTFCDLDSSFGSRIIQTVSVFCVILSTIIIMGMSRALSHNYVEEMGEAEISE